MSDVRVARRRRGALALGLAAITVASLVGNVVAIEAARGIYTREQEVRLDPLGLRYHAAERASANASKTKPLLVLYGDSRVAMWTPPPPLPGWDVVNLGVGFQTTTQALLRFDYDAAPFHPTVVVFEVGVNDLKDLAVFSDRRDAIVHACEENIAALVAKARSVGAEVVLATVFDLGEAAFWRRPFWRPAPVEEAIAQVNTFIRSQARDGVVVLEAAPILDDRAGKIRASYQADHLHLVPGAYVALNEKVASIVRAFPPDAR